MGQRFIYMHLMVQRIESEAIHKWGTKEHESLHTSKPNPIQLKYNQSGHLTLWISILY